MVFGTGTSAHDICQELQAAGADVTMVQRSPTMVVNVEPAQLYDRTYLGDGPPIASRDILNSGVPLPVMKLAHKLVTDEVKRLDAPLLTRLEAAGFRLEYGEDGTGWPLKFRTRGGGYYFNVGASELIADGRIKLVQAADIEAYVAGGVRMRDGTTRKADLFVLATGYKGPDHLLTQLFGADVARRVGRVWGFDETTRRSSATCGRARRSRACGSWAARSRRHESTALHRAADRCDRGGAAGEGGVSARAHAHRVSRRSSLSRLRGRWRAPVRGALRITRASLCPACRASAIHASFDKCGVGSGRRRPSHARTHLCVLAAHFARALLIRSRPKNQEGAGNAGCLLHPRSRVQ